MTSFSSSSLASHETLLRFLALGNEKLSLVKELTGTHNLLSNAVSSALSAGSLSSAFIFSSRRSLCPFIPVAADTESLVGSQKC